MRKYMSVAVLTALVAVSGCSNQSSVVGKWDCKTDKVTYAEGKKDIYEYLADGTEIIKIAQGDSQPIEIAGQWKSLDGNRISTTTGGKTNVRVFKFESDKLLFKSSSSDEYSIKCDRAK